MPEAYLTIDDSPSKHTDQLVDFLVERGVPAVFYVRGAFMEAPEMFQKIVRAIDKGFLIGNHSYAHDRTSAAGFDEQTAQILKTQNLIEKSYAAAGQIQPIKTIRFPHMDRGTSAWIVDFDRIAPEYRAYVEKLFWDGLRVETVDRPGQDLFALKDRMQNWLKEQEFRILPTSGITHPWFVNSEMAEAIDAMYTFSTSDWMLTPRHKGHWPYKTTEDLKQKIDDDEWLHKSDSAHIILAHDDRENSLEITTSLIDHFLENDFEFLPFS